MPWTPGTDSFIPSLTWQCDPQVERVVRGFGADAVIVDFGAGGRKIAENVVTVDFTEFPGMDLVADILNAPIRTESVDAVIATGVLEHVRHVDVFIAEIGRILRPGGVVHIEIPFLQQYHADPIDCRRLTLPGLEMFLEQNGFQIENRGVHIGPTVTILTLVTHYWAMVFEGRRFVHKLLSNAVFASLSILFYPFKFLDAFLCKKAGAHRLAFGVYCTARKA